MHFDMTDQDRWWTYRVPGRTAIVIAAGFTACTAMLLIGEFLRLKALGQPLMGLAFDAVIVATCAALLGFFLRRVMTVRLTRVGIVLNGLWRLPWANVRTATFVLVLGKPHVRVWALRGGFRFVPFSIPLYYVGHPPMVQLLKEILPSTHPIHACLERASAQGVWS